MQMLNAKSGALGLFRRLMLKSRCYEMLKDGMT